MYFSFHATAVKEGFVIFQTVLITGIYFKTVLIS